MTLFMTGGSGFIGQHLLPQIKDLKRLNVYQLKSDPLKLESGDILRTRGELNLQFSNENQLSEVEVLLLLGSYTPKFSNSFPAIPECLDSLNVTQKLCSGIFPNLKKVIFISSMDVYKRSDLEIDELSEVEIVNSYVATKLMSEHIVESYCQQNKIKYDILRVGHVFGHGDFVYKKVFSNMVQAIRLGTTFKAHGSVGQSLNLIYVKDLVDIIIQAIHDKTSAGILNVVSSSNLTIKDLIVELEKATNTKLKIEVIENSRSNFQYRFNNEKLKLNYIFRETPFEVAVSEIVKNTAC